MRLWITSYGGPALVTGDVIDQGAVNDDYPNDNGDAPLQPAGAWIDGQIEYDADIDVLGFAANAGDLLRVRVNGTAYGAGVNVDVFAADLRIGGGRIYSYIDSDIDVLVAVPATFTGSRVGVRVRTEQNAPVPYRVRVDPAGVADSSGGDSCASATALTPGSTGQARAVAPLESKWFAVDALQGHVYAITLNTRSESDYGSTRGGVFSECSSQAANVSYQSYIRHDAAGPMFIQVYNWGSSNEVYALGVRDDGYVDDPEGTTASTARTLPSDASIVSGNIDYRTDVDAFRLAAPPRSLVKIEFRPLGQQAGWAIGISSLLPSMAQESVLFPYQSYAWPSTATGFVWDSDYFVVPARTDLTSYLRVMNYVFGGYQIRSSIVQSNIGIDAAASCDAPLRMEVGESLRMSTASLEEPAVSRVELMKGRRYRFTVNGATGFAPFPGPILLLPGCGERVTSPDASEHQNVPLREWEPDQTGRYNLKLDTGAYRESATALVRIDDLGEATDRVGNDAAHATDLASARQPAFDRIDYNGDADVFKVRLAPNVTHRLQLRSANRSVNADVVPPTDVSGGLNLQGIYDADYSRREYSSALLAPTQEMCT